MEHHLRRIQALATVCIAFGLSGSVARLAQRAPAPLELALMGVAVAILFTLLAWAGALAARGARPVERLGLARGRLGAPALLVLVAGMLVLNLGVDSAVRAFEVRDTGSLARFDRAVAKARGPALAVAALALALLPAFAEEVFFRGWLQRGLAARLRPAWGVTLAAGAFAVAHLDPVHAAAAFPLGLYLGAAAEIAASTRAAILCHAAGNLAAVLVGATGLGPRALAPALVPAALASAALALWAARRLGATGSVRGRHAGGQQVPDPEEEREQQQP